MLNYKAVEFLRIALLLARGEARREVPCIDVVYDLADSGVRSKFWNMVKRLEFLRHLVYREINSFDWRISSFTGSSGSRIKRNRTSGISFSMLPDIINIRNSIH